MLTMRVIPTSGTALVGGIDVVKRPAEAKRLIGVVPQTNTPDSRSSSSTSPPPASTPLESIRWLQLAVLANPLVYISEGFRAALREVPTMSLWAIYPVMVGFTALFTYRGIKGFTKRVIA